MSVQKEGHAGRQPGRNPLEIGLEAGAEWLALPQISSWQCAGGLLLHAVPHPAATLTSFHLHAPCRPLLATLQASQAAEGGDLEGLRLRPGLAMSQDGRNWARIESEHHTGALFDVGQEGEWDELFIGGPQVGGRLAAVGRWLAGSSGWVAGWEQAGWSCCCLHWFKLCTATLLALTAGTNAHACPPLSGPALCLPFHLALNLTLFSSPSPPLAPPGGGSGAA